MSASSLVRLSIFISIVLLSPTSAVAAAASSSTVGVGAVYQGVNWTNVYPNGSTDVNGQVLYGIQMMFLVPHKGKLYAGNGSNGEIHPELGYTDTQVLVLDSVNGKWRSDKQLIGANRVNNLQSLTFHTDVNGNPIDEKNILLVAPNDDTGHFNVLARDDDNNTWIRTADFVVPNTTGNFMPRAMTLYRDPITATDHVFLGVKGGGVYRGGYDENAPGKISWNEVSEFAPPPEFRITGFAEANGHLFCSASSAGDLTIVSGLIYERTLNGSNPVWQLIYTTEAGTPWEDVRGLTAVPNPEGPGQCLVYAWHNQVFRIDPASSPIKVTVEQNMINIISSATGLRVPNVVAAFRPRK